jgi:hypothetical protein
VAVSRVRLFRSTVAVAQSRQVCDDRTCPPSALKLQRRTPARARSKFSRARAATGHAAFAGAETD